MLFAIFQILNIVRVGLNRNEDGAWMVNVLWGGEAVDTTQASPVKYDMKVVRWFTIMAIVYGPCPFGVRYGAQAGSGMHGAASSGAAKRPYRGFMRLCNAAISRNCNDLFWMRMSPFAWNCDRVRLTVSSLSPR